MLRSLLLSAAFTLSASAGPPPLDVLTSLPQAVRTCFLSNANRTSCGWPGMSAQTCADRGCCWDASDAGRPWCFYTQRSPDAPAAPGTTIRYAGSQTAPTVASALGAAHAAVAGDAAAGLACLSFPPLAGECDFNGGGASASYSWPLDVLVNSQPPALDLAFTWLPYELQRASATAAGAAVTTALRLSGTLPLALLMLNISTGSSAGMASFALPMHFAEFPGTWDWGRPFASSDPSDYVVSLWSDGSGASSADRHSAAVAASAASASPAASTTLTWGLGSISGAGLPSGTSTTLRVTWPAGAPVSVGLVLAVGTSAADVAALAARAAANFSDAWQSAKSDWTDLWENVFSPPGSGGGMFSGSLPVLPWPAAAAKTTAVAAAASAGTGAYRFDSRAAPRAAPMGHAAAASLARAYYGGVASLLQLLRRVNGTSGWRLPTAAPVWAVTDTYLWDTSMVASVMALLEPVGFRAIIAEVLSIDTHTHYAFDYLSGAGVGPWYSFNDISVFTLLDRYGRASALRRAVDVALVGGTAVRAERDAAGDSLASADASWYNETVAGRRVVEWMDAAATFYLSLPTDGAGGLADYGMAENLLECVPTYLHAVPALNAANVQMLNRTAAVWTALGNASRAAHLLDLAAALLPRVLAMRVPGEGFFACVYPNGSSVPVRHVIDFISIGDAIPWALDAETRTSMRAFLFDELISQAAPNASCATNGTWLRALALDDPAAPASDRADHGPLGAYDGWPARTALALGELGFAGDAVAFLAAAAGVLDEGPFGQAHRLFLDDVPRKAGGDGGQDALESVGGAFAEAALQLLAQIADLGTHAPESSGS